MNAEDGIFAPIMSGNAWDRFVGNLVVKRAIEIAVVGNLSLVFVGSEELRQDFFAVFRFG